MRRGRNKFARAASPVAHPMPRMQQPITALAASLQLSTDGFYRSRIILSSSACSHTAATWRQPQPAQRSRVARCSLESLCRRERGHHRLIEAMVGSGGVRGGVLPSRSMTLRAPSPASRKPGASRADARLLSIAGTSDRGRHRVEVRMPCLPATRAVDRVSVEKLLGKTPAAKDHPIVWVVAAKRSDHRHTRAEA